MMGFYIRKSVSVGPFRFNLSKSGIGISTGIKGFRVGMSPKGTYVHMGRGGLYYRVTIPHNKPRKAQRIVERPFNPGATQPLRIPGVDEMREIESAEVTTIVDSSSAELVAEMNSKRKLLQLWPFSTAAVIAVAFVAVYLGAPAGLLVAISPVALTAAVITSVWDRLRKTTVLMYELEPTVQSKVERLHAAIAALSGCSSAWHISAHGKVTDWKRNAGAGKLLNRHSISIGTATNPAHVKTNVATPSIPVGRQTLYFFPDKLLVFEPNGVGAVSYENLSIRFAPSRFIEDGNVPDDTAVVGHTWKFVNKKGGPDRRFNNNRRLPIVLYEDILLTSSTGLNELIQVSKTGPGSVLDAAIAALTTVNSKVSMRTRD